MSAPDICLTHVFAAGPGGGNPAPIVLDATGMTDADMRAVAREHGHESGFVLPAPDDSGCDFAQHSASRDGTPDRQSVPPVSRRTGSSRSNSSSPPDVR